MRDGAGGEGTGIASGIHTVFDTPRFLQILQRIFGGGGNFVTLPNLTNTINDMKKILLLFAAVGTLISAGCSDNDEKTGSDELVGTTWAYTETDSDYSINETLVFKSASTCVYSLVEKENGITVTDISTTGKYTYNPPIVKINISYEGQNATKELTVSGNTMSDASGYTFTLKD